MIHKISNINRFIVVAVFHYSNNHNNKNVFILQFSTINMLFFKIGSLSKRVNILYKVERKRCTNSQFFFFFNVDTRDRITINQLIKIFFTTRTPSFYKHKNRITVHWYEKLYNTWAQLFIFYSKGSNDATSFNELSLCTPEVRAFTNNYNVITKVGA